MIKEVLLGTSIAVLIFLFILGYNTLPFLLLGGLGLLVYFLGEKKGLLGTSANFSSYVQTVNFTFEDIGGQNSAKQELKEALDFVIHANQLSKMGIRPLKGILLTGPPGTGKTLLAKAAASY
ncbi:MAG: AAA family ATPase, partial [Thermacetogeniaceae bacterium]